MSAEPLGLAPMTVRSVTGQPIYYLPLTGYTKPPLSLNDRGKGWRGKAAKTKALREVVAWQAMGLGVAPTPFAHVELHYVPRDNRVRDRDNLVATLKPCIDALTRQGKGASCRMLEDDDPGHVSWSPPVIHPADGHGPRLWLVVKCFTSRPEGTL